MRSFPLLFVVVVRPRSDVVFVSPPCCCFCSSSDPKLFLLPLLCFLLLPAWIRTLCLFPLFVYVMLLCCVIYVCLLIVLSVAVYCLLCLICLCCLCVCLFRARIRKTLSGRRGIDPTLVLNLLDASRSSRPRFL